MNVSLTQELEAYVREKLESGGYSSASEVIREGLRSLQEKDALLEAALGETRRAVALGIAEADAGKFATSTPDEMKKRVQRRIRRRS